MSPDNDRPIVDPAEGLSSLGFSESLRPAAEPVDTYVRPATPQPSSLHGLAQALSGFSQDLSGFLKQRQAKQDDADKMRGEAAAYEANGVGYAEGVRNGTIPPQNSPVFMQSYKQAQGAILGKRLAAGALDAYQTWPDRNDTDPANFDQFLGTYLKGKLGDIDDPDVLAGVLPYVHSTADALYSQNEKERSDATYNGSVATHIASSAMSIDNAQDVALAHSQGIDYQGMWDGLMQDRQQALASGIRAEDYDKSMVDMIHSKALEYMDPAMLGLLKNRVPGQAYTYDDQDGSKGTQDTLDTMESRQAHIDALKAAQEARDNKAALDAATSQAVSALASNPAAPLDPNLIAEGTKYDPAFAVHAREWGKTLASPVTVPDDQNFITELQRQIIAGAPQSSITDEIGKDIHDPSNVTGLLNLYNTVHSKTMDAVLQNPIAKRSLAYLQQAFPALDDIGMAIPGGTSPDAIQAQTDFMGAMAEWYAEHPDATFNEVSDHATKVLQTVLPIINQQRPEQNHYVRPDAMASDMQGSRSTPPAPPMLTPDVTTKALDDAVAAAHQPTKGNPIRDPWMQDQPPTLDKLVPEQQAKINQLATAQGVAPEVIIRKEYDLLKLEQQRIAPPHPTPSASDGADGGDYGYWNAR